MRLFSRLLATSFLFYITCELGIRGYGGQQQRRSRTRITDTDGKRAARFGCPATAQAARLATFTLRFLRPPSGNIRGFVLLDQQPTNRR